jgi:hypothetical protein
MICDTSSYFAFVGVVCLSFKSFLCFFLLHTKD